MSTRGPRYKYSEGERVLCYEPDPTKAKVLYDSKVLEVIDNKDRRGRRNIEYLIHFQGWNSSWDRCVSEDFVLKDTEENRQLQKELADKAQLQLRERKRGNGGPGGLGGPGGPGGPGGSKRLRLGFSDDGSSSSTQQEGEERERDRVMDSESSGEDAVQSPEPVTSPPPPPPPPSGGGRSHLTLPADLRDRLTFDFHLVVKRGRLARLPADPCVADILEAFVRWFARAGSLPHGRASARQDPPAPRQDVLDAMRSKLNLLREVVDGLRVYFDFILRGHLLYRQEYAQYHDVCGRYLDAKETKKCHQEIQFKLANDDIMKSVEMLEYAHLPPDPMDPFGNIVMDAEWRTLSNSFMANRDRLDALETTGSNCQVETKQSVVQPSGKVTVNHHKYMLSSVLDDPPPRRERPAETVTAATAVTATVTSATAAAATATTAASTPPAPAPAPAPAPSKGSSRANPRVGTVARRLRSHKSLVSPPEEEQASAPAAAPQGQDPAPAPSVGSSGSSASDGSRSAPAAAAAAAAAAAGAPAVAVAAAPAPAPTPADSRANVCAALEKWELIEREGTEHLPCRVYGSIHLARLLVKLPEFLSATPMPDFKLKAILKHLDIFVNFLNDHKEWFGETYYIPENSSRSH